MFLKRLYFITLYETSEKFTIMYGQVRYIANNWEIRICILIPIAYIHLRSHVDIKHF